MKMKRIEIIVPITKYNETRLVLSKQNVPGMTVTQVLGCGVQKGTPEYASDENLELELRPKQMFTIFTTEDAVGKIVEAVKKELYTGHIGDGKIFVSDVENAVRIRTGDEGADALKQKK